MLNFPKACTTNQAPELTIRPVKSAVHMLGSRAYLSLEKQPGLISEMAGFVQIKNCSYFEELRNELETCKFVNRKGLKNHSFSLQKNEFKV